MEIGSIFAGNGALLLCQGKYMISKISIPSILHHIFIVVNRVRFSGFFICFYSAGYVCGVGKDVICVVTQKLFQFGQVDIGIIFLRSTELRNNQCAFINNLVGKLIRDTVFTVRAETVSI